MVLGRRGGGEVGAGGTGGSTAANVNISEASTHGF